jgi:hypothetical protein
MVFPHFSRRKHPKSVLLTFYQKQQKIQITKKKDQIGIRAVFLQKKNWFEMYPPQ